MKIIDYNIIDNRIICKICGIKLFTHKIKVKRKKNYVVLIKENGKKIYNPKIKGLKIHFNGSYNVVKLYAPMPNFINCNFKLGDCNEIKIEKSDYDISSLTIDSLYNSRVEIGKNFLIVGGHFVADYKTKIKIGDDCMFSTAINIKTTDGHVLYDLDNKKFIAPKSVIIGNHVWIGAFAKILKGSIIPDGCVIGLNSLVTKKFGEKNCTIGGNPARVLKRNIWWERDVYCDMKKYKNENKILHRIKSKMR